MDRRWILAACVAIAAVTSGILLGRGVTVPGSAAPPVSEPFVAGPAENQPDDAILVHVAGWVVRPGLVEIAEGGRVGDALAAAGGVRAGAVLEHLNLAQVLADGQQVVVPGPGGVEAPATASGVGADDGLVHLNSATVEQLESLPGVGPVLAGRIVEFRDRAGPFEQVEDLLEVSGIGEAKLASLRDHVVVP